MAATDTFSRDRLMPALLDRLIDENPTSPHESAETRVLGRQRLRQSVLRDLKWLFNATAGLERGDANDPLALAHGSTVNFGIRSLSGMLASKLDLIDLERMIRQAIIDFEPRILADTLRVRGVPPLDPLGHHNVLQFEISGRLWAQPYPLEILLKTDLDLESGLVEVKEGAVAIGEAQRRGG
jgi:type VI secretion system protein ImpF